MSDEKMKVDLGVDIAVTGADALEAITRHIKDLESRIKAVNASIRTTANRVGASLGQGDRDVARQARETLGFDRDRLRVFKMQMKFQDRLRSDAVKAVEQERRATERALRERLSFSAAMSRQRLSEEREVQHEVERTGRAQLAHERALNREQARNRRALGARASDVGRHGADAYRGLTRTPAVAAAASAAATGALARRAVGAEIDIDAAEINAAIYGKLTKQVARDLRDKWAAPLSEQLGVGTAKLLTSYVDAIKLGIPTEGAKSFAELNTKVSEAWSVPFEAVTDVMGTINTILTSKGAKFDIAKLHSVANTLQTLAAGQSTTPEKLIAFLQRGAGAAQVLGMSQESGLAFGSASTSLGNQSAESGRLFDYMASRLVELPRLTRKKGDEGRDARQMLKSMGYSSAEDMDRKRRESPDAFLPDFVQRMHDIKDPKAKERALRFFAGREWFGELGRMVEGASTYQEAVKLQQQAKTFDAIEDVWSKHKEKLSVILKRIRAGFVNLLGEVGKVFSPILNDFADYFLAWSRKLSNGGITERVKALVDGFVEGLGFRNIPELLSGMFGSPGEGSAGAVATFKATAKAFAEGVREVFTAIKGVVGALVGGDPETIARWTGRIVALSVALTALSPVLAVLGGLVAVIKTLEAALAGAAALKGLAAGSAAGAAVWTVAGQMIGVAFLAKIADQLGILKAPDGSKGMGRSILEFLDPGLASRIYGDGESKAGDGRWQDPPMRKPLQELKQQLGETTEILKEGAKVQRQSLDAMEDAPFKALIHKAAIGSTVTNIGDAIRNNARGATGLSGSIGGGTIGGGSPLSTSTPGGSIAGLSGMNRRGIMGGYGGGSTAPTGGAARNFASLAPKIMGDLQRDFGLDRESAAAILGNLGHESAGMTAFQEGNPRGGGRGGWGWAQWTGPRRRQFEAWAAQRGLDPKSYEANYGFLKHELSGAYKGSIAAVKGATGLDQKTIAFENSYERAGVKHYNRRIGYARTAMGLDGNSSGGSAGAGISSRAVDAARSLVGMGSSQAAAALGARMTPGRWCADFVNGALRAGNIRGVNSSVANSFLNWGTQVTDKIKEGDVVVTHRGRGPGQPGGHVGLATGNTRTRDGRLQYETVSGNHSGQVGTGWENADSVAVRRAAESVSSMQEAARAAGTVRVPSGQIGGARNAFGGVNPMGGSGGLGSSTPIRRAPVGSGGGAGAGGGQTVNHVTVNGANMSPNEMSAAVQRALGQAMDRRTHDVDGYA